MSSSSLCSSASSLSSLDSSPSFPSSLSAASHLRSKRRDAISHAAESEWDASPSTMAALSPPPPPQPPQTSTLPPWHGTDDLICPLVSSDAPLPPFELPSCLMPPTTSEDDIDDLQAMLAHFSFPTPSHSPSSSKHRRSGEVIDHSSAPATSDGDTGIGRGTS